MTLQDKIKRIKALGVDHSRTHGYAALARRFKVSPSTLRYYIDDNYRERINLNAVVWRDKHPIKFKKYQRKYQAERRLRENNI